MLSEKGIIREHELVVYPVPVAVVIGDLEKEVNQRYAPLDEHYDVIGKPGKDSGATTYHVRNKESSRYCLLVWFPSLDMCRGSFMCHEAGHIALEVFKYVEALVDYENQEPFCYLLGSVFMFINKTFYEYSEFLEKKDKKNPKPKKK